MTAVSTVTRLPVTIDSGLRAEPNDCGAAAASWRALRSGDRYVRSRHGRVHDCRSAAGNCALILREHSGDRSVSDDLRAHVRTEFTDIDRADRFTSAPKVVDVVARRFLCGQSCCGCRARLLVACRRPYPAGPRGGPVRPKCKRLGGRFGGTTTSGAGARNCQWRDHRCHRGRCAARRIHGRTFGLALDICRGCRPFGRRTGRVDLSPSTRHCGASACGTAQTPRGDWCPGRVPDTADNHFVGRGRLYRVHLYRTVFVGIGGTYAKLRLVSF